MFEVGDYVVHGNSGICVVKDISPIDMPGAASGRLYYILSTVGNVESRIYSPVDNVKVVLRKILTADEARHIINDIPDIPETEFANEKFVENQYKEMISSCDIRRLISLVKSLRHKQAKRVADGKKITSTDERYLKRAEYGVVSELALSLGMEREEVIEILSKFE